jgi:DNA-binding NarL/FixJ family response regulator
MIYLPKARHVLIVDDHPPLQRAFAETVEMAFQGVTVSCVDSVAAADRKRAKLKLLDMVLVDLGLPGYRDIEALVAARRRWPDIPNVVISARDDLTAILSALNSGAAGYITKNSPLKLIIAALRLVAEGGIYAPAHVFKHLPVPPTSVRPGEDVPLTRLTPRQREVLREIIKGRSHAEIASSLGISETTVKHHAHAIYAAAGVDRRRELLALAAAGGIRQDGTAIATNSKVPAP